MASRLEESRRGADIASTNSAVREASFIASNTPLSRTSPERTAGAARFCRAGSGFAADGTSSAECAGASRQGRRASAAASAAAEAAIAILCSVFILQPGWSGPRSFRENPPAKRGRGNSGPKGARQIYRHAKSAHVFLKRKICPGIFFAGLYPMRIFHIFPAFCKSRYNALKAAPSRQRAEGRPAILRLARARHSRISCGKNNKPPFEAAAFWGSRGV